MDSTQTTINSASKGMSSKKKIIIIAAIAAAVVLVVAGIIIAVVLNNRYLDSMKDYDPVNTTIYNGYEIVNEDGLYYLTKDGKKVSKTGYTMLESVNTRHYSTSKGINLLKRDGVKFYDYFIARKEDANTYFLLDGEGEELAIEGENLDYIESYLPFIVFADNVTGEYGILSLEKLDSDIASASDETISIKMYDDYEPYQVNERVATYFLMELDDETPGADAPKTYYVNAEGSVLFASVNGADEYILIDTDDDDCEAKDWLWYCADGRLYNGVGELLSTDIESVEGIGADYNSVMALKSVESDDGEKTEEIIIFSGDIAFRVSDADYQVRSAQFYGNVMTVNYKDEAKLAAYDITTGTKTDCQSVTDKRYDDYVRGTVVLVNDANYTYVDAKTGKTLITTTFGDMTWYNGMTGVMVSATESGANATATYLHFVAPAKTSVALTLNVGESISNIFSDGNGCDAYIIKSVNDTLTTDYTITKKALYVPFANGAVKTASYDDIQELEVFAEGASIVLATDYDSNKYDLIDVASGTVIKSIAPGNAESMALTTVEYDDTYALFNDYDQGVEFAVFKTVVKDVNGDTVKEEFYALSRNQVMKGEDNILNSTNYGITLEEYATGAISVTELGDNIDNIVASNKDDFIGDFYRAYSNASKYMIVRVSEWSSDIYEIKSDLTLAKVCNIPYYVRDVITYGSELSNAYLEVYNNATGEVAIYGLDGEMILGYHDHIEVTYDGEYFIASRQGVCGAYKYDIEKGRIKQILDFEFGEIVYVGDGGFVTCESTLYNAPLANGDMYLYDGKNTAKSDPISSMFSLPNYYIDEETGELMASSNCYYNFGGEFYVHRREGVKVVDNEPVGIYYAGDIQVKNTAPTVVVFRGTDGEVIQSKVIYPTAKSIFEFQMADSDVWYDVSTKELQKKSAPETADKIKAEISDDILNGRYEGGVINVYKAHADLNTPSAQ